jgi:uncharacterized integral membrane protein
MPESPHTRKAAADPVAAPAPATGTGTPAKPGTPGTPAVARVPRTRAGALWLGICVTTLCFVVLIIFMLQNTRSTEITFLWMRGTLPLALALLIASVGAAIITMVVGTARITQLRRFSRRTRR